MFRYSLVIICTLVLFNVEFINARKIVGGRGGRHSYNITAYSGHHGYPKSLSNSSFILYNRCRWRSENYPPNATYTHIYNPPRRISYASPQGRPALYPVYRGAPPTYVYQYKDSGSKYGTLLAGLALLNLGALTEGIAGYRRSHLHSHVPRMGEVCLFGIKKENGDYEQTKIDCQLTTSFIYQEVAASNTVIETRVSIITTGTKTTNVVNSPNPAPDAPQSPDPVNFNLNFTMLPNGTLIPINVSTNGTGNATSPEPAAAAGGVSSVQTTNTTTTTVVSALDVKGAPVSVTPGMECYVIKKIGSSTVMRRALPCDLLQIYAEKSFKKA